MTVVHHEVPTHLDVEDKVLFGLTVRQFMLLLVGSSASYALWQQAATLGDVLRWAAAVVCGGVTLVFVLLRPADRALEEWLAVALLFVASPRRTVWRPREPLAAEWRLASGGWQELAPSLVWADEEDG
jgi:uncharacterized membrane protein YfcA